MISHKDCAHPSTPSARAKCRRALQGGKPKEVWHPPMVLPQGRASVKVLDDDNYGQTPKDKSRECHVCGVEKIEFRGTDSLTGLLLFVGEKCKYMVKRSPDFAEVP